MEKIAYRQEDRDAIIAAKTAEGKRLVRDHIGLGENYLVFEDDTQGKIDAEIEALKQRVAALEEKLKTGQTGP